MAGVFTALGGLRLRLVHLLFLPFGLLVADAGAAWQRTLHCVCLTVAAPVVLDVAASVVDPLSASWLRAIVTLASLALTGAGVWPGYLVFS